MKIFTQRNLVQIFDYPDFVTKDSGQNQINKYDEVTNCIDFNLKSKNCSYIIYFKNKLRLSFFLL